MERGVFQSMLLGDEGSGSSSTAFVDQIDDDAYLNAMYSSMNTQSFPSVTDDKPLLPLPDPGYGTFPAALPLSFGFPGAGGEDFAAAQCQQASECSANGGRKLKSIDFAFAEEELIVPKYEPFSNVEEFNAISTEAFDFIPKNSDSISKLYCSSGFRNLYLPDLRSIEQVRDDFEFTDESPKKRVKSFCPCADPGTLESVANNFAFKDYFTGLSPPKFQPPAMIPQRELARQRRQRFSEKTRNLQRLLPGDKKLDMATVFEEAYKYVKFLQAQISVLQSMPLDCSNFSTQIHGNVDLFGAGLGGLNRQQLLQVLVNSPVAQTVLYSQGNCVYSIEQLVLLKQMADRQALFQQLVSTDRSVLD